MKQRLPELGYKIQPVGTTHLDDCRKPQLFLPMASTPFRLHTVCVHHTPLALFEARLCVVQIHNFVAYQEVTSWEQNNHEMSWNCQMVVHCVVSSPNLLVQNEVTHHWVCFGWVYFGTFSGS